MDWPTRLGLIMGIIATADLAYKYGSALFKKTTDSHVGEKTTNTSRKVAVATTVKPDLLSYGGNLLLLCSHHGSFKKT